MKMTYSEKFRKELTKKICKKSSILADLYIYSLREATANRYIVPKIINEKFMFN